MVGYAFMGQAHSQAWRNVHRFFDVPVVPRMAALCGRDLDRATAAASRMGWSAVETDWRELVRRDDVHLVDVCTPGDSHAEIALTALASGKHVLCEKPLSNSVAEAEEMTAAAERAQADGVIAMVGFNYRRVPAIAFARELVAAGRIGRIHHVRALYLQDWITDPEFPLVWRLQKDKAGSGALGDIGAHIIDQGEYLCGPIESVAGGSLSIQISKRPLPLGAVIGHNAAPVSSEMGEVENEDTATFTARYTAADWGSPEMAALLDEAVPDPRDHLDFRALDRPLDGVGAGSLDDGRSERRELVRDAAPDAAAASGDHDDLVRQQSFLEHDAPISPRSLSARPPGVCDFRAPRPCWCDHTGVAWTGACTVSFPSSWSASCWPTHGPGPPCGCCSPSRPTSST